MLLQYLALMYRCLLPYLGRFRVRSASSPCQYHEPTAPMNNCSPFCNEIGNDLDPDMYQWRIIYLHRRQRLPSRLGKNLACGIPTFLATNKDQLTMSWQCLSSMLHPLIIPVISFTKSNSTHLAQRGLSTIYTLKYKVGQNNISLG